VGLRGRRASSSTLESKIKSLGIDKGRFKRVFAG
jgi:hypothetical protein